jgi:hypothetical protein
VIASPAQLFANGSPTLASYDFRLKAGSPALDAGTALANLAADILGTPRPQGNAHDVGAYEFVD